MNLELYAKVVHQREKPIPIHLHNLMAPVLKRQMDSVHLFSEATELKIDSFMRAFVQRN